MIAIIGILVALLLPAIQAARESAHRAECTNNMRQLALAVHDFDMANEQLPMGTNNPTGPIENLPNGEHISWIGRILPYLEEGAKYEQLDLNASAYSAKNDPVRQSSIELLECPSAPTERGPFSNYAGCHNDVETPINTDNNGVLFLNSEVKRSDMKDGPTYTMLLGEKYVDEHDLGWLSGTAATLRNTGNPINERPEDWRAGRACLPGSSRCRTIRNSARIRKRARLSSVEAEYGNRRRRRYCRGANWVAIPIIRSPSADSAAAITRAATLRSATARCGSWPIRLSRACYGDWRIAPTAILSTLENSSDELSTSAAPPRHPRPAGRTERRRLANPYNRTTVRPRIYNCHGRRFARARRSVGYNSPTTLGRRGLLACACRSVRYPEQCPCPGASFHPLPRFCDVCSPSFGLSRHLACRSFARCQLGPDRAGRGPGPARR